MLSLQRVARHALLLPSAVWLPLAAERHGLPRGLAHHLPTTARVPYFHSFRSALWKWSAAVTSVRPYLVSFRPLQLPYPLPYAIVNIAGPPTHKVNELQQLQQLQPVREMERRRRIPEPAGKFRYLPLFCDPHHSHFTHSSTLKLVAPGRIIS